jgi:hypothetical protein
LPDNTCRLGPILAARAGLVAELIANSYVYGKGCAAR